MNRPFPFNESVSDETGTSVFERVVALLLFAALLTVNTVLISLRIMDFPVRALAAIGLLGALIVIYPERVLEEVQKHALLLWLTAGLAALGVFVSLANATPIGRVWQGVMEVPLQVAVTLLVASALVQIAGYRACIAVFVAVILASSLVAMLQFGGMESMWQLRLDLWKFQNEPPLPALENRRPMGLSYSPIQLSTQLCLAFGVFAAAREMGRKSIGKALDLDLLILAAAVMLVAGSVFTLTRSPILGAGIFVVIYMLLRPGSWLIAIALLGGVALLVAGPFLMEYLQDNATRVVRTDDGSALARASMNIYGLLLIADNPLGYGYAFKPSDHATKFWQYLYHTPAPGALMEKELHNYFLNMLNTYGLGLILLAPIIYQLLSRARAALLFFVPYIVHIIFHNSGPFWTDVPFWFVVAILSSIPAAHSDFGEIKAPDLRG